MKPLSQTATRFARAPLRALRRALRRRWRLRRGAARRPQSGRDRSDTQEVVVMGGRQKTKNNNKFVGRSMAPARVFHNARRGRGDRERRADRRVPSRPRLPPRAQAPAHARSRGPRRLPLRDDS